MNKQILAMEKRHRNHKWAVPGLIFNRVVVELSAEDDTATDGVGEEFSEVKKLRMPQTEFPSDRRRQ